jgi:hypothetical protein
MTMDLDGRLVAVESALYRWVNMMMGQSVTVRWIAGLPVSVTARWRHIVLSMAAHLLRPLGNVHPLPGMPIRLFDI